MKSLKLFFWILVASFLECSKSSNGRARVLAAPKFSVGPADVLKNRVNKAKARQEAELIREFYARTPEKGKAAIQEYVDSIVLAYEYDLLTSTSKTKDVIYTLIEGLNEVFTVTPSMTPFGNVQMRALLEGRPDFIYSIRNGIKFFNPPDSEQDLLLKAAYEKFDISVDPEDYKKRAEALLQAPGDAASPDEVIYFCFNQLALLLNYNLNSAKHRAQQLNFANISSAAVGNFMNFYRVIWNNNWIIHMLLRKLLAITRLETAELQRKALGDLAPEVTFFIQNVKYNEHPRDEPVFYLTSMDHGIIQLKHTTVITESMRANAEISLLYLNFGKVALALLNQVPQELRKHWLYIYREHREGHSIHSWERRHNDTLWQKILDNVQRMREPSVVKLLMILNRHFTESVQDKFKERAFQMLSGAEIKEIEAWKERYVSGPGPIETETPMPSPKQKPSHTQNRRIRNRNAAAGKRSPGRSSIATQVGNEEETELTEENTQGDQLIVGPKIKTSSNVIDLDEFDENEVEHVESTTADENVEVSDQASLAAEEIERELEGYRAEMLHYNQIKRAPKFSFQPKIDPELNVQMAKTGEIVREERSPTDFKCSFMDEYEFRCLLPKADLVYRENMLNRVNTIALADSSIKLGWMFNPNVIIGQQTFLFLLQLFNLVDGTNLINFDNFLSCVKDLHGVELRSAKNRKFKFRHRFVMVDGTVVYPPVGSAHREHKSSRFNRKQVTKLLLHAGAHPYFFRVLVSNSQIERL